MMNAPEPLHIKPQAKATSIQAEHFVPAEQRQINQLKQRNSLKIILGLVFTVFALMLWFIFNARSVSFNFTPEPTTMNVSGLHFKMSDHYLMLAGRYQLSAQLAGFYPINEKIQVTDEQNQQLKLAFKPLPGKVKLTVSGAEFTPDADQLTVKIDDKSVVLENFTIDNVAAGEHQLAITSARYLPWSKNIEVQGKTLTDEIAIELQPAWAEVTIETIPAQVQVSVADKVLGVTPLTTRLLQGEHQLSFSQIGYQTTTRNLVVKAGQTVSLPTVELVLQTAQITIVTKPQQVSVSLGEQFLGKTPLTIAIAPGKAQQLTLSKAGYASKRDTFDVLPEQKLRKNYQLTPLIGQVSFDVSPSDALLYVDNRLLGRANGSFSLPIKQQHIRIEREGFVAFEQQLLPNSQLTQQLQVQLKTLEQAKWENMPQQIQTITGSQLLLFKPNVQFTMGASRREQGRRANEAVHQVKLTRPFYLATTEVTNREFHQFEMSHSSGNVKGHSLNGANQPVVRVSWLQAAKFCNWLSIKQQLPEFYQIKDDKVIGFNENSIGYRLPTEAEWAFVARYEQQQMKKFGWGESIVPENKSTNIADVTGASFLGDIIAEYTDGYPVSAPVASFAANQHKLFDLDGNVAEWMHDFYHIPSALSLAVSQNPLGPSLGQYHVIRGQSWAMGDRTHLRLSYRDYSDKGKEDVGFRVARFVEPLANATETEANEASND